DLLEGRKDFDRRARASLDGLREEGELGGAARQEDSGDLGLAARGHEEVERPLDLAGDRVDHPFDDLAELRRRRTHFGPTALEPLGLFEADVEALSDLVADEIAAVADV